MAGDLRSKFDAIRQRASEKPHGVRARYISGCRCDACRRANTAYEVARDKARKNGDWNGNVPADRAVAHLRWLSKHGVGKLAVAAASDVGKSTICDILAGRKTKIRARSERRILAVTLDQRSDGAIIPAGRTHRLIRQLREEGFTGVFLAKQLGYQGSRAIQIGGERVTVRNAARVRRLHERLTT